MHTDARKTGYLHSQGTSHGHHKIRYAPYTRDALITAFNGVIICL